MNTLLQAIKDKTNLKTIVLRS